MAYRMGVGSRPFGEHVRERIRQSMDQTHDDAVDLARESEDRMKTSHPFNNISGYAEDALYADVHHERVRDRDRISIQMGYRPSIIRASPTGRGRNYGYDLELMQGGRFATVGPEADRMRAALGRRVKARWSW